MCLPRAKVHRIGAVRLTTFLLSGATLVSSLVAQTVYDPYEVTTIAGKSSRQPLFNQPLGIATDTNGNLFVADTGNHTIRKITPDTFVSTLAGRPGISGNADATRTAATFNSPQGIAVDSNGTLYVGDSGNNLIRKITAAGVVTTLAGSPGAAGSADGSGSAARFSSPRGIAVDSAGNIYVADTFNHTIRKITAAGSVATLAGSAGNAGAVDGAGSAARFSSPVGIAVDGAGNCYVGDANNNTIRKITPDGVVTTFAGAAGTVGTADGSGPAARFYSPRGIALDSSGNIYVADFGNSTIRRITPDGSVTTFAGSAGAPGSTDSTGLAASFNSPQALVVGSGGNLFVADSLNDTIRKIMPNAAVTTFVGTAGTAGSADGGGQFATFAGGSGLVTDSSNVLYVADTANHVIRKLATDGTISTFAGSLGVSGNVDGTGTTAQFGQPLGLAIDTAGNLYVTDQQYFTVRKISPSGAVTTLASLTGSVASLFGPIAVDQNGYVYVSAGISSGQGIVQISPAGSASTYVQLNGVGPLAIDLNNNIYAGVTCDLATCGSTGALVYKLAPDRTMTRFAGAPGTRGIADGTGDAAQFYTVGQMAIDPAGNLYVSDSGENTLRKITPARTVTTLAGAPGQGGTVDGRGAAARFQFYSHSDGIAVDAGGRLYILQTFDGALRSAIAAPNPPPTPLVVSPLIVSTPINQQFVYQFETIGATSLSVANLPDGLAFSPSLAAIIGTPTVGGTFQIQLSASNSYGTTTATLTLSVQAVSSGPVITSGTSAKGRVGQPFSFQVLTTGGSAALRLSAVDLPAGLTIDPVSGVITGTPQQPGSFAVRLSATDGNASASSTLELTFTADAALPVITSPKSVTLTPGQPFSYTIAAPANSDPGDVTNYALVFNLPTGLSFDAKTGTISGKYLGSALRDGESTARALSGGVISNVQLFATNSHGVATTPLTFFAAPIGSVNISTRLAVGTADNVLIGGFIVTGNAPKKVLIRAIGPSLPVSGALQDTTLELYQGATLLGSNDDWRTNQEQEIQDTGVAPTNDRESAIVATLAAQTGYTAIVRGKGGSTGIALAEIYDLGTASLDSSSTSHLANISTRGTVLTADNVMIGGFIISGANTAILARAIGPSLGAQGVSGALQDTILELHDSSGSLVASNDDWRSTQEQQIIDTTVPPPDDRESAIVATLQPGAYTAVVRGKNDSTGVALVEIYSLQ